jgi:hypothetical protein
MSGTKELTVSLGQKGAVQQENDPSGGAATGTVVIG